MRCILVQACIGCDYMRIVHVRIAWMENISKAELTAEPRFVVMVVLCLIRNSHLKRSLGGAKSPRGVRASDGRRGRVVWQSWLNVATFSREVNTWTHLFHQRNQCLRYLQNVLDAGIHARRMCSGC